MSPLQVLVSAMTSILCAVSAPAPIASLGIPGLPTIIGGKITYLALTLGPAAASAITPPPHGLILFDSPVYSNAQIDGPTAAQQALGNVFAGLVLLFARPFHVGDAIRLRAGALGGTLDGIVTDIGITYVRFDTGGSVMSIPNSQVLNAVVGPIPPTPEAEVSPPVATDSRSGTPGGPEQAQPRPAGPA